MTNSAPNSNLTSKTRRAWLVQVLLVGAYAAFNLTLDPSGTTVHQAPQYLAMPLMGAIVAQPVMFAIWAALATGPAVVRIPLSLSAASLVFLTSAIKRWNLFRVSEVPPMRDGVFVDLALFGLALILLLVARYLLGWTIRFQHKRHSDDKDNQFSLKYLLVLTVICAALLMAGRTLLIGEFFSHSTAVQVLSRALVFAGVFLLTLFPLLIIPLTALAQHPSRPMLVAMPFLWAGLTWLAVEIIAAQSGEPRLEIAKAITLLQGGAMVTGLLSAVALRFGGYRLVKGGTLT